MKRQPRPGLTRTTLSFQEMERSYLLLHPKTTIRLPLVVMLHGAGGSAEFASEETGWSRLADEKGFAVVYPEGLAVRPEKKAKFLTNPQEWNDGSERGRHEDVDFIRTILDQLNGQIDTKKIYLTGFSNGAGMSFRFASEHAHRVAAIAPVAGHCWIDPKPARPVPTFYIFGDSDPLVPIAGGIVRTPWGTTEHRPAVAETIEKWGQSIGHRPPAEFFRIAQVAHHGHHWPGGRGLLGERLGGPIATTLDATQEIWQFFASQSL